MGRRDSLNKVHVVNEQTSPYESRRGEPNSARNNTSPSRTRHHDPSQGGRSFPRKWTTSFHRQERYHRMNGFMENENYYSGAQQFGKSLKKTQPPSCLNFANLDRSSYTPCDCDQCVARNRSLWVHVPEVYKFPVMEIQTRIKYGVESRFGPVEDVKAVAVAGRKPGINFIVRQVKLTLP